MKKLVVPGGTASGLADIGGQGMCALLSRPQQDLLSHFTAQQTARWTRLAQHFSTSPTGPQSDDETEEPRGTPARASSKRKREKATGEPAARSQKRTCGKRDDNDPWYRFTKLESLEIPALYEAHLQKHGSDAAAFLNDQRELTRLGPEARSDEGDAFLSRLQYTLHLQGRMAKDRIRWCFSMLLYFDLAQLENPGGSGRVGGAMQKRIRDLVKDRVPADRVQDLHLDSLTVWSTCGKKLDIICKEFGEGSLFFLDGLLSEYL